MNTSKSALNSLITHLQRVVERAKAEPKDCRTQDALRLLRAKDLPYLKRRLKAESQSKQEQSKQEQEIDWEQRRYEIAKEMLPVLYQQSAEILKCGQSITWEEKAVCALVLADTLIAKLKEQSE